MKKLLFCLWISVFTLYGFSAINGQNPEQELIEYVVKKGDTLWGISKRFNVEIKELLRSNKVSQHDSGLPLIKVGESIYISKVDYRNNLNRICLDPSKGMNFVNLSESNMDEIASKCIETLSYAYPDILDSKDLDKSLTEEFWKEYLTDPVLPYFIYNLHSMMEWENQSLQVKNAEKIMILGALRGDKIVSPFVLYATEYFHTRHQDLSESPNDLLNKIVSYYPKEHQALFFWTQKGELDQIKDYKKFIDFDVSNLTNQQKASYFENMLRILYMTEDPAFFILESDALEFLNLTLSDVPSYGELSLVINMMYYNLGLNRKEKVISISDFFLSKLKLYPDEEANYQLGENSKLEVLYNKFTENVVYAFEQRAYDYILTYILNHHSVYFDLNPFDSSIFKKEREYLMNFVYEIYEQTEIEALNYASEGALSAWHSDTGLYMVEKSNCQEGEKHLKKAFSIYDDETDRLSRTNTDAFNEPLLLSMCFLDNDNDKAKDYLEYSLTNYENYFKDDFAYETLSKLVGISLESDLSKKIIDIEKTINDLFLNEYALGFSWNKIIDNINSIYIKIYNRLESKELNETLVHPIEIAYLRERLENIKNIKNIKIKGNEKELELISGKLKTNREKILEVEMELMEENSELNPKFLTELYGKRSLLVEELFNYKNNLKNLMSPDYRFLEEFIDKLKDDEVILNYNLTTAGSYVWLITKDKFLYITLDKSYNFFSYHIKKLKSSLEIKNGNLGNFDILTSNLLYKELFEKVEKYIGKDKTIYLFGSDLESLPFNALASYVANSNNKLQQLIESRFLIEDYNFVSVFPLSKQRNDAYENKFISFANPSILKEIGLTSLPSAEDEANFLAMASGDESEYYLGENASKKNLINALSKSYERIHLGTHSVPPYWNGLTSESSIVLDSDIGDFLLTTSEISGLDIRANVVILASCNSSIEGFDSLYKSFLVAGSNSVIYSNWDLETQSSNAFTEEMFKNLWLDEDLPLHEAMRAAILKLKDPATGAKYISPSYWANFTIAYSSI